MAKFQTQQDNFDDGIIAPAAWGTVGPAQIAETGGLLQITSTTGAGYYTLFSFNTALDLTSSYGYVQTSNAASGVITSLETYLEFQIDGSNSVHFFISSFDGTIKARKKVAGTSTPLASATYNATTHKWLRIREEAGTTYWDYTSDPDLGWTNMASAANPIALTALQALITVGTFAAEVSTAVIAFDNFNTRSTGRIGVLPQVKVGDGMSRSVVM